MACMCGDLFCGSCGPAQGNFRCSCCGQWAADGGCADPDACARTLAKSEAAMVDELIALEEAAREYGVGDDE